ncbi:MAG: threonine synthase [Bacteroidetes bacterium]|jgi:threonine synthase|nr:threonine synthase [Bacteroidota bacterium]MBT6686016.1 threonine synthase [Bacteroidota bacterium]MBT7142308.1 threonine synthase [Bacteroidota bacterium]MBT7492672.1 threonine synthase [Bacteroidota bacterium]
MKNPLLFYSTNQKAKPLTFGEALIKGLAPDKGLYMPEKIPSFTKEEIASFSKMEYHEIAFAVGKKFLYGQISDENLFEIVKDAYNFSVPLEKVYDNKFVMRLDQGPTASFKDFAARMMGRLMQYFLKINNRNLLILTATSGDTGSAIANAFYGLNNIKVLVLYPKTEVTDRQRKQMTTLGENINTIALDGKFDDCQALVKEAFSDSELDYLNLSSANSINIGRLIPQIVYYFYSFAKLRKGTENDDIIFSVPSGNFGDMMGGIIAKNMGLPIKKFVIATNENDEFPKFLSSGEYEKIEPSKDCLSSAMNVGHPSNIPRLIALYGGVMDEKGNIFKQPDMQKLRNDIFAICVNDEETKTTIKNAYDEYQLLLEPHGAVGWKGLQTYLSENPEDKNQVCVSFETAHPAKFPEQINNILNFDPELPDSLKGLENRQEIITDMSKSYIDFKNYLKDNY